MERGKYDRAACVLTRLGTVGESPADARRTKGREGKFVGTVEVSLEEWEHVERKFLKTNTLPSVYTTTGMKAVPSLSTILVSMLYDVQLQYSLRLSAGIKRQRTVRLPVP